MEMSYAEVCLQVGERRVACHHCGNVRKDFLQCSDCPQVFCRNCAEKVAAEHGIDVFTQGCPVCKKLCCCAAKSVNCSHVNHCYRKCPASKVRVASGNKNLVKLQCLPHMKSSGTSLDLLAAACENANITHNRQEEIQQSKRSYSMMEQNNEVMSELSCSTSSSSSSENGLLSSSKKQKMNDGSVATAVMSAVNPYQGHAVKSFDREHRSVVATMPQVPHAAATFAFSSSAASMMPMTSMSWVYMPVQVPVSMAPVSMPENCGQQVIYRLPSSYYFTPTSHIGQERHVQYQQAKLLQAQQAYAKPLPLPLPQVSQQQKYPDWLLRPSYPIGALRINQRSSDEVNVGGISSEQF